VYRQQGCLREAAGCLHQSLTLARTTGDRGAEAYALHTVGDASREQGRLEEAASSPERSLATFHDIGCRPWEARALNSLGLLLAGNELVEESAGHAAFIVHHACGEARRQTAEEGS
jgi:hypothetical protein